MPNDLSSTHIIEWVVGIMLLGGGSMLGIVKLMVNGKRNKAECDLIHQAINIGLTDIKQRLEKGDVKMDGMNNTLTEISTTLKLRSLNETERYDKHSDEWKNK